MKGVYIIENKINGKIYVGASSNISKRFRSHMYRYSDIDGKEYDKKLYVEMRLYGLDNFNFSILEECDDIFNREKFHILELSKSGYILYNKMSEDHPNHILTESDVVDIRTRYVGTEDKDTVYRDYSNTISYSGFSKIWNGATWKHIMPHIYENQDIRRKPNRGFKEVRYKLYRSDIIAIRSAKIDGLNMNDVYEKDFKDRISKKGFYNIWNNYSRKEIQLINPVSTIPFVGK